MTQSLFLTQAELDEVNAAASALGLGRGNDSDFLRQERPDVLWQLLAGMEDQYAVAAYRGLSDPTSLYGKVIAASNKIAGVTDAKK
jgi:hypothetical protein